MRTAADCFSELWRLIRAGETVPRETIESLANEAEAKGCDIAVAATRDALGMLTPIQAYAKGFGPKWLADTAELRVGDAPTLIFQN